MTTSETDHWDEVWQAPSVRAIDPDEYARRGEPLVKTYYPKDHTHTSAEGAEMNAESVTEALQNAHSPLAAYLKPTNG